MPRTMARTAYADMYGPTTGDRVRLADTDRSARGCAQSCCPMILGDRVAGRLVRSAMGRLLSRGLRWCWFPIGKLSAQQSSIDPTD
jgi:urease alpha subunit